MPLFLAHPLDRLRHALSRTFGDRLAVGRRTRSVFDAPRRNAGDLFGELAGPETERYSFRGEDPHPSEILLKRSKSKHRVGELYGEIVDQDADLFGLLDKRSRAVQGLAVGRGTARPGL